LLIIVEGAPRRRLSPRLRQCSGSAPMVALDGGGALDHGAEMTTCAIFGTIITS
jgi:hypothetical protein